MSKVQDDHQVQQLLKGITIPPQPQILCDIRAFQQNKQADINQLAEAISKDVGLSGGVLKAINSPFFGLPRKITSVKQAVVMLGVDVVSNIITGLVLRGSFSDDNAMDLSAFWDTAMNVANIMMLLSRKLRLAKPEEAYTFGLFHNCGIVLLYQKEAAYMQVARQAYQQSRLSIVEYENQHLNTNHAVVGYYVAKAWHLPMPICMAIQQHHNIDTLLNDPYMDKELVLLVFLLKMAEHITEVPFSLGGAMSDYEWLQHGDAILAHLGINADYWQYLKDECIEFLISPL